MVCQEVMLLPEMLEAGVQALEESAGQTVEQRVIACYLAMRAIEEIAIMRRPGEALH